MGPTWVLSAPDGPHVGPMNLAIRAVPDGFPVIPVQEAMYFSGQPACVYWHAVINSIMCKFNLCFHISCNRLPVLIWMNWKAGLELKSISSQFASQRSQQQGPFACRTTTDASKPHNHCLNRATLGVMAMRIPPRKRNRHLSNHLMSQDSWFVWWRFHQIYGKLAIVESVIWRVNSSVVEIRKWKSNWITPLLGCDYISRPVLLWLISICKRGTEKKSNINVYHVFWGWINKKLILGKLFWSKHYTWNF